MHPLLAFDVIVVLIVLGAAMTCLLFYIPISWPHPSPLTDSAKTRICRGTWGSSEVQKGYKSRSPEFLRKRDVESADKAMSSEVPQQLTVSLGEVLEVRGAPLQVHEAWALLWLLSSELSAKSSPLLTRSPQLPLKEKVASEEARHILQQVLLNKNGQVYFVSQNSGCVLHIRSVAAALLAALPDKVNDSAIKVLESFISTENLTRKDIKKTVEHWSELIPTRLKPNPAQIMAACYAEVLGSNSQICDRALSEMDDCLEGGYLTEDSAISSGLSRHTSLNSLDVLPSTVPNAFCATGGRGGTGGTRNSSSLPSLSLSPAPTTTSNSTDYAYSVVTVLQAPASPTAQSNLDNRLACDRQDNPSHPASSVPDDSCPSKIRRISDETSDKRLPKAQLNSNRPNQPQQPYVSKGSVTGKDIVKRRHPVQRAPSRLYKLLGDAMNSSLSWSQHLKKKYEALASSTTPTATLTSFPKLKENTHCATEINSYCTGPEFVVRSALPAHQIQLAGKKKGRVLIVALDGRRIEVECNLSRVSVGEILKVTTSHLGLADVSYYGLACLRNGQFVFTPSEFKIVKMAPSLWKGNRSRGLPTDTFTVYLRFKCYFRDLDALKPTTRHWLYLQLRRDVLENRLPLKQEDCIHLASLALQAEFGDYVEQVHGKGEYFVLNHYFPAWLWTNQRSAGDTVDRRNHAATEDWVRQTLESRHRSHQGVGISRSQAERLFLMYLIQCPTYGQYSFDVVEDDSTTTTPMTLSVSLKGLELTEATKPVSALAPIPSGLRSSKHSSFVPWKHIAKISHTRHDLIITLCHSGAKHRFCVGATRMLEVYELISAHASIARHQCNYLSSSVLCLPSHTASVSNNTKSPEDPTNSVPIDIVPQHEEEEELEAFPFPEASNATVNKIKIFVPFSDLDSTKPLDQQEQFAPETSREAMEIGNDNQVTLRRDKPLANAKLMKTTNVIIIDPDDNPPSIQHSRGSSDGLLFLASYNYGKKEEDLSSGNDSAAITALNNTAESKVTCRRSQSYSLSATTSPTKKSAVVRMGTRISAAALNRQRLRSIDNIYATLNVPLSVQPENLVLRSSSGAYVVDMSVRSVDETVFCDGSESISCSLAERFDRLAQVSPSHPSNIRIRLNKDEKGALGILVARGASGGVFLMGLTPGGPAALEGTLQPGDRIISVNGYSFEDITYAEAIDYLRQAPETVEILVSQQEVRL